MGKGPNKKENILVTKVDRGGDPRGESLRLVCPKTKEILKAVLGEYTNFSPKKMNGQPNPNYIPIQNTAVECKEPHLDYDEYFNFVDSSGKKVSQCIAQYYREDIEDYYYYIEMIDRCDRNPRFKTGEFEYIGNVNTKFVREIG